MNDKQYRHGLVSAQIEVDLPLQIRALRKQLVGTQPEMAKLTGMKQSRISAMEKPGGVHFNIETLRRLAEAFDVALIVRFAPFSELLEWSDNFSPDTFRVPSFPDDLKQSEMRTPEKRSTSVLGGFFAGPGPMPSLRKPMSVITDFQKMGELPMASGIAIMSTTPRFHGYQMTVEAKDIKMGVLGSNPSPFIIEHPKEQLHHAGRE